MDPTVKNPIAKIAALLDCYKRNDVTPNFWVSVEYLQRSQLGWNEKHGLKGVVMEDGTWFIPPMTKNQNQIEIQADNVWAGIPISSPTEKIPGLSFLDHQFIYDPKRFLSMTGGDWAVFRKNSRKYPNRAIFKNALEYRRLAFREKEYEIEKLILEGNLSKKDLYDPDMIVTLLLYGSFRMGLFDNGSLIGVNVYDCNYQYINFRLSVCQNAPFLNEYLRLLFYTKVNVLDLGLLVNDGGSLGLPGLYDFKMKMNPLTVMKVFSKPRKD